MSDSPGLRSFADCIQELLAAAGLPDYQAFSEVPAYRALIGLPERPETRERRRRLREFGLGLPVLPPLLAGPMPELVLDEPAPPAPLPRGRRPDFLILDDPVRALGGVEVFESPFVPDGHVVVARPPELPAPEPVPVPRGSVPLPYLFGFGLKDIARIPWSGA